VAEVAFQVALVWRLNIYPFRVLSFVLSGFFFFLPVYFYFKFLAIDHADFVCFDKESDWYCSLRLTCLDLEIVQAVVNYWPCHSTMQWTLNNVNDRIVYQEVDPFSTLVLINQHPSCRRYCLEDTDRNKVIQQLPCPGTTTFVFGKCDICFGHLQSWIEVSVFTQHLHDICFLFFFVPFPSHCS
jgi:hypothetical protein